MESLIKNKQMKNLLFLALFTILGSTACHLDTKTNKVSKKPTDKPKNVLFIAVDDLKPLLGCYDTPLIKTPNIDKLASQGYVFKNNHCQQAVCGPSRASILTGKRPDYTKIWNLKTLIRDKNPDIVTMPQYFKQLGYQTAAVGKIFDYRSVDELNDSLSWSYKYDNFKHHTDIGKEYIKSKERVSMEITNVPDSMTADGEVVRRSVKYLKKFAKEDKPFFMAVGFYKPHLPFVVPQKYWDLYRDEDIKLPPYRKAPVGAPKYATQPSWELRGGYADIPKDYNVEIPVQKQLDLIHGYYACVSFIDQQIGRVLDELDKLGLRESTVIVLWGDHGWHLGDHDMFCKHTNYEQATRSPLIFSTFKGKTGSTDSPTEFVDVYPTLCDLSGIKTPQDLDGKSLVPLIDGKVQKIKDYAVSQFPREGNKMGYAFRDERYRYVIWVKNHFNSEKHFDDSLVDAEELYDYNVDPLETKNLISENKYLKTASKFRKTAKDFFKKFEKK